MTTTNTNYKYEITVEGEGGDFAFVPMTTDQWLFWRKKSEDELSTHLYTGGEGDGTPPRCILGNYYDYDDTASGICLRDGATLRVKDETGAVCLKKSVGESDIGGMITVSRYIDPKPCEVFFRTCEKVGLMYELDLREPFDPNQLSLCATVTPTGVLITYAIYDGKKISSESYINKDRGYHIAAMFASA